MTQKLPVLVTGGAGYIGSHAVLALKDAGWPVVVIDNLTTGFRWAVPEEVPFYEGDIEDGALLARIIAEQGVGAVMHFAGSIIVPESVENPLKYYHNNTAKSRALIAAAVAGGVRHFIFSSTAATYGVPEVSPVSEDSPKLPINPYGMSKLMSEHMLKDLCAATSMRHVILRYFNVAGCDPAGRIGQSTRNATLLIKVACEHAVGTRDRLCVFGTDYDTADGTCIRDYIHVVDLATAHLQALDYLDLGGTSTTLNCGYGHGYSVREVIDSVERVSGEKLNIVFEPRRAGDPPALIARSERLKTALGWKPKHDELDFIVRTALDWERKLAVARSRPM